MIPKKERYDTNPWRTHEAYSLERHGPLDVTSQIHDLSSNSRNESMSSMFLGVIIARDGQDYIGRFGSSRDTEYGTREEDSVRAASG